MVFTETGGCMSVTLEDLAARVCVLERLVGEHGDRPFSADDAFKDVRNRITSLQLSVISLRRQTEELIDDVHDQGSMGAAVAAIASHLGVTVHEDEARP
ncbi:hypothetical protein ACIA8C_38715 [Nocardia sp. NPDC051321]|uniref:hypothetical protein n=1 Tax=Nocardia sp. NPDC051321 TaxID=3364323 RepID=UPI00378FBCB8